MMQYFEWYLPDDGQLWTKCADAAGELKKEGINMIWLPPAYKAASGRSSVGYDVYDRYDLGEFEQKGSIITKYGGRKEYLEAVKALHDNGIAVIADIVLNHMMGADEAEEVMALENSPDDRGQEVNGPRKIKAWTRFTFAGRGGKYSGREWNANDFSGIDWDDFEKRNGIFCFEGKNWNQETDSENGNYDYLMGADIDTDNPDTVRAVTDWGRWYIDTIEMDGFRLDAVKHISFDFYRQWLASMREYMALKYAESEESGRTKATGRLSGDNCGSAVPDRIRGFAVGEYWSDEVSKLTHYLDTVHDTMSLFDVPLHFAFCRAASSDGDFDLASVFNASLVRARPDNAVTFVDNHDTQPGQALASFVPAWFKPAAYALILLRAQGIPCVFYGDYYGIPHDNIPPVRELGVLIRIRKLLAYGEQRDYFDSCDLIGFTRSGDDEHPNSGVAVVITDREHGEKRMKMGERFAGCEFYDALERFNEPVVLDENGEGDFKVKGGSVSVWVNKAALTCVLQV